MSTCKYQSSIEKSAAFLSSQIAPVIFVAALWGPRCPNARQGKKASLRGATLIRRWNASFVCTCSLPPSAYRKKTEHPCWSGSARSSEVASRKGCWRTTWPERHDVVPACKHAASQKFSLPSCGRRLSGMATGWPSGRALPKSCWRQASTVRVARCDPSRGQA